MEEEAIHTKSNDHLGHKLKINRNEGKFLDETINYWKSNGVLGPEEAEKLYQSYEVRAFDWMLLAKYSFWIAIISGVIAIVAIVADDWVVALIEQLFEASDLAVCLFLSVAASIAYFVGYRRRKSYPQKIFSNEAYLLVGVLLTAGAIGFLGKAIDNGSGHFSLLFLLSTAIYSVLAWWFPSKLVWVFALLALGNWFGAETGYISGWGAYFLGMNYPLRFVLFGGVLTTVAIGLRQHPKLQHFYKPTFAMGLLYLFISLWILSIFGNYGDWSLWSEAQQITLFHWGLLFGLVAIAAIGYGLKTDDRTARGFGITFLLINLYTKYFEYFWDVSHKALFFMLMALSFWWLGQKAEAIWNLEFFRKPKKEPQNPV